jgi:predicted nuclease of restriction endonuclease-like (RecB) superfamily
MKLFHETYGADEKLAPLVREIGWSHNVVILELSTAHSERELERALTAHVEEFLREMGGMFAFVGSQHRLSVGGRDYFLDLLLYHRRVRALVAIELKVGEFAPEYVGKMQFYLAALDDTVRLEGEAPAIGIILCKSKNRTVVEYALRRASSPIGVATYEITSSPPPGLETDLPRPDQVAKLLDPE